ncbi:helix-turn-helix domain-containing protein, partial [Lactobacillus sp. XV13L]|nr:helix-turn-helix domain-containing protein [Lactobacillus sp. XV13L]
VGISRQAVISIERYKYMPSLELAFNLAKAFHLTVTDVFYQEE